MIRLLNFRTLSAYCIALAWSLGLAGSASGYLESIENTYPHFRFRFAGELFKGHLDPDGNFDLHDFAVALSTATDGFLVNASIPRVPHTSHGYEFLDPTASHRGPYDQGADAIGLVRLNHHQDAWMLRTVVYADRLDEVRDTPTLISVRAAGAVSTLCFHWLRHPPDDQTHLYDHQMAWRVLLRAGALPSSDCAGAPALSVTSP